MTVQTIPAGVLIKRQDFGAMNFDLEFSGGDNGGVQVAVNGPPRWTCALGSDDNLDQDQAAAWRALILSLKGRVNHLAVYDLLNPAPRGSMRGNMQAAVAAAAGANSMTIFAAGQGGKTLKRGDWIGVNQASTGRQLLHVQADAVADGSGNITVTFEPVLRVAVAQSAAIVWDKPTCLMKRNTQETSWQSQGATQGGFSLDLVEQWF